MYPLNFFNFFPPFPRDNKIFVAMDFNKRFNIRWEEVIKPAIEHIKHKEILLEAYRVDMGKGSNSIFTEILQGISNCKLFFADLTTIGYLDEKTVVRNGNVMYEVGIAQAVRLPEEVIIFRSDNDPLPFDITNLRVNNYDPDNKPDEAINEVNKAISSAFGEIDLQKHLAVIQVAESLDYSCISTLLLAETEGLEIDSKKLRENPVLANSISHLLELGILRTQYNKLSSEILPKLLKTKSLHIFMSYKITPFGIEVLKEAITRVVI